MHHHLPCGLAIDPASDQRPRHHRQRNLNALKVAEQVYQLAFWPALSTHLRYRFGQHNPPLQISAKGHCVLRGVSMADRCILLGWSLALYAIAAQHLAAPVITVPRLENSIWYRT